MIHEHLEVKQRTDDFSAAAAQLRKVCSIGQEEGLG